jgi:FixJ family two-component response regulator
MNMESPDFDTDFSILIADDDEDYSQYISSLLRSHNYNVRYIQGSEYNLDRILESRFDILLLDVFLGNTNGLDLIPDIKCRYPDCIVIVMTGYPDKDVIIKSLHLGAFDFLEKPFPAELLLHVISRTMRTLYDKRKVTRLFYDLHKSQAELLSNQERLEYLNNQLRKTNNALAIFAQNIENEKEDLEKRIAVKLRSLIVPAVESLRIYKNSEHYSSQIDMLIKQVEDLTSDFSPDANLAFKLSITEFRIASLIKHGVTTEEIARQLHVSPSTVRSHRKNIRKKLNINDATHSLKNFLYSCERHNSQHRRR